MKKIHGLKGNTSAKSQTPRAFSEFAGTRCRVDKFYPDIHGVKLKNINTSKPLHPDVENERDSVLVIFKPDWHPSLNTIIGDISDEEGYITEYGTFRLIGPTHTNSTLTKNNYTTEIRGPLLMLSADNQSGFF